MSINDELVKLLVDAGAAKVGFAGLGCLPAEAGKGFSRAVSIAVRINPAVLEGMDKAPKNECADEYTGLNKLLDSAGDAAVRFLEGKGFKALNMRRDDVKVSRETLTSELPHKTTATLAGMGWIGKCALLVTEEFGPAVRISTVLTDAPLDTAKPVTESRCGACDICARTCPGQAASGKNWSSSMSRADFFDAFKCRDAITARAEKFGVPRTAGCGLCIVVCPRSRRGLSRGGAEQRG
jgi:epoxyqueuosine reductase QueG